MTVLRKPRRRWWLKVGPFPESCHVQPLPSAPPGAWGMGTVCVRFPPKEAQNGVLPAGWALEEKLP